MGLGCPVVDREQDRVNANSGSQVVLTPGHQRKGRRFCGVDAGSQAQCLVPKPALETRVGAPTAGWRPAPGAKAPAPFCPVSPGQGAWASGDVGAPEQAGGDRLRGRERGKPRDVQSGRGGLKRGERRCQCGTAVSRGPWGPWGCSAEPRFRTLCSKSLVGHVLGDANPERGQSRRWQELKTTTESISRDPLFTGGKPRPMENE